MPDSYQTVNGVSALNVVAVNEVAIKGELLVADLATGFRPVLLGAMVGAGIAQRTLVADSRMMGLTVTPDGRLLTLPYGPPSDRGLTTPVVTPADTSVHALISARAAGIKISLWAIEIVAPGAGTITFSCPSLGTLGVFGITAPGRFIGPLPVPMQTGAAEAFNYQLSVSGVFTLTPFWFITKD